MTDIRLDDTNQLQLQTNGDCSLISGSESFLQMLRLEAASAEGDLWYDPEWGWSLLDFAQAVQDDLVTLEIKQRCRTKLEAHEEIAVDSIQVTVSWEESAVTVALAFRLLDDNELYRLGINIGRTEIEVIDID